MAGIRIDSIPSLSVVVIALGRKDASEEALFMGVTGESDERQANFVSRNYVGDPYQWSAYRMNGRWCYGSSGDPLRILSVEKVINGSTQVDSSA